MSEGFEVVISRIAEILSQCEKRLAPETLSSCLERIGNFFAADRCFLLEFGSTPETLRPRMLWTREGIPAGGPLGEAPPEVHHPWYAGELGRGEAVCCRTLDDLPESADIEREFLRSQGVASTLSVPAFVSGSPVCVLGLDHAQPVEDWPPRTIERLRVLAKMFASTIARLQALTEVRGLNEILEEAQRIGRSGSWTWNIRTGDTWWSNGLYRIYERDPAQGAPGEDWLDQVHPDDREALLTATEQSLVSGSYRAEYRFRPEGWDSGWKTLQAEAEVQRDDTGQPSWMIGVAVDISELRRTEHEREDLREELFQSQKLEALGQVAGALAHDFNNLLMVIYGNAEMAGNEIPEEHAARVRLQEIHRACAQGTQLVGRILAPAHLRGEVRAIDLGAASHEMRSLLEIVIGRRCHLELTTDADLRAVKMSPGQLEQVLINLAANARDAMEGSGTLTIGVTATPGSSASVRLEISDTGCGMSEQVLDRVFEPFFTTKPRERGTGLGLSTVRRIVSSAGGEITVESEKGRGTTFHIDLPTTDEIPGASATKSAARSAAESEGETILFCDDEDAVRTVIAQMLELADYQVIAVSSGSEALAILEAGEAEIDLLLTDFTMPEMDGREVLERARKIVPKIPAIVLSGYTAEYWGGATQPPADVRFLSKPIGGDELLAAVRTQLDAVRRPQIS